MIIIRKFLKNITNNLLSIFVRTKNIILFIPHRGFYVHDNASIVNFRSDNSLTYLNYILENDLYPNYQFILASTKVNDKLALEQDVISKYYPNRKIYLIDFFEFDGGNKSLLERILKRRLILSCRIIISSEPHYISFRRKQQLVICAGYYPAPFKNDFIPVKSPYYMNYKYECSFYDYFISNSKLASHLDASSSGVTLDKYINIGQCRLDNLVYNCNYIREELKKSVNYPVKYIALYTPTHRDYESNNSISRSILGFKYNRNKLETFLEKNKILIVCKLHPKQNRLVVDEELPRGVINFRGNSHYGLTELMISSDILITDYTSSYYEYLLLDKPIIFNFYDYYEYEICRGFVIDEIREICAGDIIRDETSFYKVLIDNLQSFKYSELRKIVKNLFFTYQDTNSCKRLYKFIDSYLCNLSES